MTRTIEPPASFGHDHVVPAPRCTDVMGEALRRAFSPTSDLPDALASLMRRLDTRH